MPFTEDDRQRLKETHESSIRNEEKIRTLDTRMDRVEDDIKGLHHGLFGNGNEGVQDEMDDLKSKIGLLKYAVGATATLAATASSIVAVIAFF